MDHPLKTKFGKEFHSIFRNKENKSYKVVNELGEGQYFGEISLITKLFRTSTVISSVGVTTCGYIVKEDFD
jgi:CRP-like cAMP-binding protein